MIPNRASARSRNVRVPAVTDATRASVGVNRRALLQPLLGGPTDSSLSRLAANLPTKIHLGKRRGLNPASFAASRAGQLGAPFRRRRRVSHSDDDYVLPSGEDDDDDDAEEEDPPTSDSDGAPARRSRGRGRGRGSDVDMWVLASGEDSGSDSDNEGEAAESGSESSGSTSSSGSGSGGSSDEDSSDEDDHIGWLDIVDVEPAPRKQSAADKAKDDAEVKHMAEKVSGAVHVPDRHRVVWCREYPGSHLSSTPRHAHVLHSPPRLEASQ